MNTYPLHRAAHAHKAPQIHPIANALLGMHDQSSYAVTEDGLICAPVGYYRILRQYGQKDPRITLAFAFSAEELALVPHPDDAQQKILKNPEFILPPRNPSLMHGSAEIMMREHQAAWLSFVLGFGNLYYGERTKSPGSGVYFSNNLIAYRIKPKYNVAGQIIGQDISYMINPYGKSYGLNFNDSRHEEFWKNFSRDSLSLGTAHDSDEAMQLIHKDFRERRLPAFMKGLEVQDWAIHDQSQQLRNIAMWCRNIAGHYGEEPETIGANLFKLSALIVGGRMTLGGVFSELATELMDAGSEHERERLANGTDLEDIADVDKDNPSPAPLHRMKSEARENWVSVDNPQPFLLSEFGACHNLEAHRRARAIDIIHDPDPVMVTPYDGCSDPGLVARTHDGMEVHFLNNGAQRLVAYAPCRAALCPTTLPATYRPLFSEKGIAMIEKVGTGEPVPEGGHLFHELPHDAKHKLVCCFLPVEEVGKRIANDALIEALHRHQMPVFVGAALQAMTEGKMAGNPVSAFRKCAYTLGHYARLIAPVQSNGQKYLAQAGVIAGLGGVNLVSHMIEGGSPLAFTVAAALMTKRMAMNALTPLGRANLNAATAAIFSFGAGAFAVDAAKEVVEGIRIVGANVGRNLETGEYAAGLLAALYFGKQSAQRALSELGCAMRLAKKRKLPAPAPKN